MRNTLRTMIGIGVAAIWLTSTGLSDQYDYLVRNGYRWVTTDGLFACRSKDDVRELLKDQSDENTLRMISKGGAYYLIQGVIVQVVQEDKASGMAQIHWDGIVGNIWMPSKFLRKRPTLNLLGDYRYSFTGQPKNSLALSSWTVAPRPSKICLKADQQRDLTFSP